MKITQIDFSKAVDFIAQWEGFEGTASRCPAGVWTIGYGHTGGVREGDTVTEEEARDILKADIGEVARQLLPYVNVSLTEGQGIALISLAFNVGPSYVVGQCPKLMRALNAQDYEACADEFLDITRAGGVELEGLKRRRQAEHDIFLS